MINQVGQIMLYVNNQDETVQFWTEKVGFQIIAEKITATDSAGLKLHRRKKQEQASSFTIKR